MLHEAGFFRDEGLPDRADRRNDRNFLLRLLSHIGIVGDLREVLPLLIEKIKAIRRNNS